MPHPIQVTLAANAGVLLSHPAGNLLIDGLFQADHVPFSSLPAGTLQALLQGHPPYDRIDYLLFTHAHPDHFSPEVVLAFLEHRRVRGVLLPPSRTPHTRLRQALADRGIPCLTAGSALPGDITLADGLRIRTLPTRHLDQKFRDVPHVALLVTLDGRDLLFTADADYTTETFPDLPPLRAVFLNPLFFHAYTGGTFFRGDFPTDTICVYHVPFPGDDTYHVRAMLARDLARHPLPGRTVQILDRPNQQVLL